jgi:AcrR family transcriptional regulator
MPRPSITPEKRAEMRLHIREAVVRLSQRAEIAPNDAKAWDEITVRDVAEEAGISVGTFYKYYKDRSELAQSLWAEPVAELRQAMQVDFDATQDPVKQVRLLLRHYAEFAIENRRLFRRAFLFVRPEGAAKPELTKLEDETFYRNLKLAFEQGQESGCFRPFDSAQMAQIFWAALHGSLAISQNLDRYDFDPPAKLSEAMIDTLLSLILA